MMPQLISACIFIHSSAVFDLLLIAYHLLVVGNRMRSWMNLVQACRELEVLGLPYMMNS